MSEQEHVPVYHRQFSNVYGVTDDNLWYPVNHRQLRDLVGKLLTQLDAMALPDRAHKAAKTLIVAEVWRWWDGVHENAVTSAEGCIAPIVSLTGGEYIEGQPSTNRWGWKSEDAWLAAHSPKDKGERVASVSTAFERKLD